MPVEIEHVGMVIGRGGDTLRRVERETGARVQFLPGTHLLNLSSTDIETQSRPGVRMANILGTLAQVNAAKAAIKAMIENTSSSKGGSRKESHGGPQRSKEGGETNKFTFTVPDKCVGLIIGRGGESINEIQRRSGARVNIVPESQSINGRRPVNLFGSDEANQKAKSLIEVIVKQDEAGLRKNPARDSDAKSTSVSLIFY
jgi:far upstream element-binding protein